MGCPLACARDNIERLELGAQVELMQTDLFPPGRAALIVCNPPYGERLLEKKEAEDLYRMFGAALRDLPPKWRVLVLSSHTEFERCFGRPADKKRKLYNGMIRCQYYMYFKA